METSRPQLIILADPPDAFSVLFGISYLERLLRVLQRLGFREAIILSNATEQVATHLTKPSWARSEVMVSVRSRNSESVQAKEMAAGVGRILVVSAGFYYDARLLESLASQAATTLLVDSDPPPNCARLWLEGEAQRSGAVVAAALLDREWLSQQDQVAPLLDQLASDAAGGRIGKCDAAQEPTYIASLRKHVRPVFFPAPSAQLVWLAEKFPRYAAQNGVLDFPGYFDAPIEDWIVARVCGTSIRPNQITFVTMLIGLGVTAFFATGRLWWGVALAGAVGVLDGVDGKLARTKVETTEAGDWEHLIDYFVELSWWTALAFNFHTQTLPSAYWLLLLLVSSDWVDRLAKRVVKKKVGRNLDDVSDFDRFVRCIGGRRNVNIWILMAALALGDAVNGFVLFCWWGAATTAAHVVRALQIRFRKPMLRNC